MPCGITCRAGCRAVRDCLRARSTGTPCREGYALCRMPPGRKYCGACPRLQEEPRTAASRWIRLSLWNGTRRWRPAAEAPILCTNPLTWLPSSDCTKADGTGERPSIPCPPLPSFGTVLCACMRVRVSVRLSVCLCVSECLCVVGCVCGRGCVCISGYGAGLWRGMCVERTAPAAPPSAREFLGPTLLHTVRRIERYLRCTVAFTALHGCRTPTRPSLCVRACVRGARLRVCARFRVIVRRCAAARSCPPSASLHL